MRRNKQAREEGSSESEKEIGNHLHGGRRGGGLGNVQGGGWWGGGGWGVLFPFNVPVA